MQDVRGQAGEIGGNVPTLRRKEEAKLQRSRMRVADSDNDRRSLDYFA
jgi:hypothetical protein